MTPWTLSPDTARSGAWVACLACLTTVALAQSGCKSSQLTDHGTEVAMLESEPLGCERLGEVEGHGGGVGGAYSKKAILSESATNRARNEAAKLGATHVVLREAEYEHGTGTAPTRNQQPALGHGDSSAAYARVEGVAYKCGPGQLPPVVENALPKIENPPASISLAPLGTLTRIVVYQKTPRVAGSAASETEVKRVEEQANIDVVADSLGDLALDPIKYIPTHRVEFVGELGTQSLLYGFGYLQYAGKTYRLTTGTFEEELGLVEPVSKPKIEINTPADSTSGGESP